jgi:DNA-binding MarR family transcriptional regulator
MRVDAEVVEREILRLLLHQKPHIKKVWTVRQICHRLPYKHQTIVSAINRLEKKGLVKRGVFRTAVRLTEEGRKLTQGGEG